MPPPAIRRTLRPSCSPSLTQRALLTIAVGAMNINELMNINDVRDSTTIFPHPCKLTFDLLTLKVVSESCVTWATSVPILVFLDLSVIDRQTDVRYRGVNLGGRGGDTSPPRIWSEGDANV